MDMYKDNRIDRIILVDHDDIEKFKETFPQYQCIEIPFDNDEEEYKEYSHYRDIRHEADISLKKNKDLTQKEITKLNQQMSWAEDRSSEYRYEGRVELNNITISEYQDLFSKCKECNIKVKDKFFSGLVNKKDFKELYPDDRCVFCGKHLDLVNPMDECYSDFTGKRMPFTYKKGRIDYIYPQKVIQSSDDLIFQLDEKYGTRSLKYITNLAIVCYECSRKRERDIDKCIAAGKRDIHKDIRVRCWIERAKFGRNNVYWDIKGIIGFIIKTFLLFSLVAFLGAISPGFKDFAEACKNSDHIFRDMPDNFVRSFRVYVEGYFDEFLNFVHTYLHK